MAQDIASVWINYLACKKCDHISLSLTERDMHEQTHATPPLKSKEK